LTQWMVFPHTGAQKYFLYKNKLRRL